MTIKIPLIRASSVIGTTRQWLDEAGAPRDQYLFFAEYDSVGMLPVINPGDLLLIAECTLDDIGEAGGTYFYRPCSGGVQCHNIQRYYGWYAEWSNLLPQIGTEAYYMPKTTKMLGQVLWNGKRSTIPPPLSDDAVEVPMMDTVMHNEWHN